MHHQEVKMAQGTVKWFNGDEGQKVEFDITQGEKGPQQKTSGSPADAPPRTRRRLR